MRNMATMFGAMSTFRGSENYRAECDGSRTFVRMQKQELCVGNGEIIAEGFLRFCAVHGDCKVSR